MLLRLALPFRTLLGMRVISRCSASSCLPGSSYGCMPAFILVIGSCLVYGFPGRKSRVCVCCGLWCVG